REREKEKEIEKYYINCRPEFIFVFFLVGKKKNIPKFKKFVYRFVFFSVTHCLNSLSHTCLVPLVEFRSFVWNSFGSFRKFINRLFSCLVVKIPLRLLSKSLILVQNHLTIRFICIVSVCIDIIFGVEKDYFL
ncbi:hypothetical protein SSS_02992, partial [Sarcoptes scabiei]